MRSCMPGELSALDSKHQSDGGFNQHHGVIVHGVNARTQSTFIIYANLFNSGTCFGGECRQLNQQWPVGWSGRAGQRNNRYCASNSIQFGQGDNDAGPGFGHVGVLHRIERYPEHVPPGNGFAHLIAVDLRRVACASKSGSHASTVSVNSAFTHSSDSRASSGYCFSSSFIRSAAWAIMRLSACCLESRSCFSKSTMYRFHCRGGTARANLAATSSGRRSSTCLGGGA